MAADEYNFDGLVGPTHNYSGLSLGNIASVKNAKEISNPKEAALQGLLKMKALHDLGLKQGVIPPQERPDISLLRRLGFSGTDERVLQTAAKQCPEILAACYSASSMWTANAATVSPSTDTADHRVHFTPANLANKFHRSIEPTTTSRVLRAIFNDARYFAHHKPLPTGEWLGDEGAANHTRFCERYDAPGVELFVYGKRGFDSRHVKPEKFPARQTLEASSAIARLHQLDPQRVVFAQQNPKVIDAGVFHNDVISVGNQNVFFCHETAFSDFAAVERELRQKAFFKEFHLIRVSERQVSVPDAVASYLFNSQLVTLPGGSMALIVPEECRTTPSVWNCLQDLLTRGTPIQEIKIYDVKQSMRNGGGPACLRLRVVLNEQEAAATNPNAIMNSDLYTRLTAWVNKHYRDRLSADDFTDPSLVRESREALDELTQILDLGSVYPFQM